MIDIILIASLFTAILCGSSQGGTHPFVALVKKCRAKVASLTVNGVSA
ncbi:hypothetical protein [Yoonia maritima]|nr:hypothetical protein [Yoonia maritima]